MRGFCSPWPYLRSAGHFWDSKVKCNCAIFFFFYGRQIKARVKHESPKNGQSRVDSSSNIVAKGFHHSTAPPPPFTILAQFPLETPQINFFASSSRQTSDSILIFLSAPSWQKPRSITPLAITILPSDLLQLPTLPASQGGPQIVRGGLTVLSKYLTWPNRNRNSRISTTTPNLSGERKSHLGRAWKRNLRQTGP